MNNYFFVDAERKQKGPLPADRLAEAGVTGETLVWRQGMQNWQPASSIEELRNLLVKPHTKANDYPQNILRKRKEPAYDTEDDDEKTQFQPKGRQPDRQSPGEEERLRKTLEELERHEPEPGFRPCPPTYMVWAILSTICCCLPFGIVAVVKARQVGKHYVTGNYDQALIASADTKKWCIVALILGILSCVLLSGLNLFLGFIQWVLHFILGFSMVSLDALDSLL